MRAHGGAGVLGNEIDAQPSDNGARVVFVQIVKGEAVVEQSRHLMEHLTSHLEVHFGPCLGNCLCGHQELIERWAYGAGRHPASVSVRPRPGKRILRWSTSAEGKAAEPLHGDRASHRSAGRRSVAADHVVVEQQGPGRGACALDQIQGVDGAVLEQVSTAPDHTGRDEQSNLVDEARSKQRLGQ
jgi:hypothetical protein